MTGTTSPIGAMLYQHLVKHHTVMSLSRNCGFDLRSKDDLMAFEQSSKEYDVFLNLAHVGYAQGDILARSNATINISFGSVITEYPWSQTCKFKGPEYIAEKLFLGYVHNELTNSFLIKLSSYGSGPIPSVTDKQIIDMITDVIQGNTLSSEVILSNGLHDLTQA